ncbi:MAG: PDZ domain-containing protein, partial [Deltaproteobacteria bacterium]|nr:PDZ domain-containing protein [Deltaproteobacteria bacterium]
MRSLILLVGLGGVVLAPTRADADPAFLGIGLDSTPSTSGCRAMSITDESAAAVAGFQTGDAIVTFAGVAIPNCASLLSQIANHAPGDEVAVEVTRIAKRRPLTVTLTSRSEVTQRRMVGRKLDVPLIGLGDDYLDPIVFDRTTIAVMASSSCMDCTYVTSKLAHR